EMNGFDDKGQIEGCFVYHAGTKLSENGKFLTNGGRVIGVTAKGDNLQQALDKAYNGVSEISFENAHYRKDIGQRALKALE
ncbi:MAG: phosphoribosylamine--glycine ligase, partial [Ruminococcus sp.]|nr:phosphoribosylamine--glycine ligase [Ruminococcus sp.]